MRSTWWPATRASLRLEPKGAVRAPSQAGRRAGPGHAGEGQATHSRPDPARRSGSLAPAGQRAADDDPADHRGHGCQRRAHPYRRGWHLRPPACLGGSAQNGLPRARRIRPRRGWRRVLRGARQHDRGVLVPAALLAPPAPGDLAGEAAALSGVLPVRAQRTPSRQSPAWRARRRLGRMRQIQHPESQQEPRKFMADTPDQTAAVKMDNPRLNHERRLEIAQGQTPFAVLVSCSDSRVPPELLFGRGLGELFIVRNAGNTVDTVALGSIEYAVAQLGVPLVLVLGHERCGAVDAALSVVEKNATFPGSIGQMIEPIIPAALQAKNAAPANADREQVLDRAVRETVRRAVTGLRSASEPILMDPLKGGQLKIVGARYDLDDGSVDFFMEN